MLLLRGRSGGMVTNSAHKYNRCAVLCVPSWPKSIKVRASVCTRGCRCARGCTDGRMHLNKKDKPIGFCIWFAFTLQKYKTGKHFAKHA